MTEVLADPRKDHRAKFDLSQDRIATPTDKPADSAGQMAVIHSASLAIDRHALSVAWPTDDLDQPCHADVLLSIAAGETP